MAKDVKTSREWINILIEEHLKNQKIKVPPEHVKYVDMVL